jgi:transcription initiation factor TFIIIB Brf1 subunit/transcription initiation factor TFIIB
MVEYCPECGGTMTYESSTKRHVCKSCGLYVTKEQLLDLREKNRELSEKDKKKKRQSEVLQWWLSKK